MRSISIVHFLFVVVLFAKPFSVADKTYDQESYSSIQRKTGTRDTGIRYARFIKDTETTVIDVALAFFKKQNLQRAAIFSCQSAADWRLIRKLSSRITTTIITPTTLWKLDNVYFRTGILVNPKACPLATILLKEGLVHPYLNATYRWLLVSQEPLQMEYFFQNITFRLDTSITVAIPESSDTYRLLDVSRNALHAPGTIQTEQVGLISVGPTSRGHRDSRIELVNWVDAENAPFRSKIHRGLHTGVLILSWRDWKRDSRLERFTLLRGHPGIPATAVAMQNFNVFTTLCDLYNISMIPHIYSQSGYKNQYGIFSGILGDLQNHKLEISASKVLVTVQRKEAADFLNTCDPFKYILWGSIPISPSFFYYNCRSKFLRRKPKNTFDFFLFTSSSFGVVFMP